MNEKIPRPTADNITYGDVTSIRGAPLSEIREEDRERAQRGAQILAAALVAEGVECLFGYEQMTPADISAAQKLARESVAKNYNGC